MATRSSTRQRRPTPDAIPIRARAGEHELKKSVHPGADQQDQPDPHPCPRVNRPIDQRHEQQEEQFRTQEAEGLEERPHPLPQPLDCHDNFGAGVPDAFHGCLTSTAVGPSDMRPGRPNKQFNAQRAGLAPDDRQEALVGLYQRRYGVGINLGVVQQDPRGGGDHAAQGHYAHGVRHGVRAARRHAALPRHHRRRTAQARQRLLAKLLAQQAIWPKPAACAAADVLRAAGHRPDCASARSLP